jgi:hypothetical protein
MLVPEAFKITAPKQPYKFYQDNIQQEITQAIVYNPSSFRLREIKSISIEEGCIIYHV